MIDLFAFVVLIAISFALLVRIGLQQYRFVPQESSQSLLKEIKRQPAATDVKGVKRFDHWFDRMIRLGGIPLSTSQVTLLIVCTAACASATMFVATEEIGPSVVLGCMWVAASILGIAVYYQRTIGKFESQLPMALDLMSRAVTAGESLDQAIGLVAGSLEEPAKTEFKRCENQLQMGLSMRSAMTSLVERVDTTNVRVMASILSVHRESGGNLSETLNRLAEVIRNRFDYERKLRTVTGAGRASVIVVAGLAWCIFGYLFLFRPEYGRALWENPSGRSMLLVAFVLEVIGMLWGAALLRKRL